MSKQCPNSIEGTDVICGDEIDGFRRYCSPACAEREGRAELESLGITPEMMKEALNDYYECKGIIEHREKEGVRQSPDTGKVFRNPYSCDQE